MLFIFWNFDWNLCAKNSFSFSFFFSNKRCPTVSKISKKCIRISVVDKAIEQCLSLTSVRHTPIFFHSEHFIIIMTVELSAFCKLSKMIKPKCKTSFLIAEVPFSLFVCVYYLGICIFFFLISFENQL